MTTSIARDAVCGGQRGRMARVVLPLMAMALVVAWSAGSAHAGELDDGCRDAGVTPAACVFTGKAGERGAAECRRGHETAGQDAAADGHCAIPVGRRVSRAAIEAHAGSWLHQALSLQYELAHDLPFANAPWLGTHNSFNSTSEFPTISHSDSNQQLSLNDQLRIDMRSLEIDAHWFPSARTGAQAPVVCHATGEHAGCTTERLLVDVLHEVAGWLNANPSQILLLYIEDNLDGQEGQDAAAAAIETALRAPDGRSLVYRPKPPANGCAGLPLEATRSDVLEAGAQVVIVSSCGAGEAWRSAVHDWDSSVAPGHAPTHVESRPHGYRDAPACDQDPDGDGVPEFDAATYETRIVRYFEDSTFVTAAGSNAGAAETDDGITPETAGRMVRCGVDLIGFDQILPQDGRLEAAVWSWAQGHPDGHGGCAAMSATGRWHARPCRERRRAAYRREDGSWTVTPGKVRHAHAIRLCRSRRATFAVPRTGAENELVRAARRKGSVWLGHRIVDGSWVALDQR